jgi:hypothetical protein
MRIARWFFFLALLIPADAVLIRAQTVGSIEVNGRVRIAGKQEKLVRKRFYLFRGGLEANRALVDRIKATTVVSRECFFCSQNASPELIAWLRSQDCESPFCRAISANDAKTVPEFKTAYESGLKKYRGKDNIALEWLTTSLPPGLVNGFYRQRKTATDTALGGVRAMQSAMTDSVSVKALFVDVPVKLEGSAKTEAYLISNIIPIEFQGKSYLWACEVDVAPSRRATLALAVPEPGKTIRKCEVVVRDLPPCTGGSCPAK